MFCFYIASLAIISQMELTLLINDMLVKDNLNYKKNGKLLFKTKNYVEM